jgi:conjugative transfer signal peptidase TraF
MLGRERRYLSGGECPGDVELLVKTIVAIPGDVVEVSDRGMAVNDVTVPNSKPMATDDLNRSMQWFPAGVYRVGPMQVWVVGASDPRSYDSRYYGPISIATIRGQAIPVFVR